MQEQATITITGRVDCTSFKGNPDIWYQEMSQLLAKRYRLPGYYVSREWYATQDKYRILDEDGWRDLPDPNFYWDHVPITEKEFKRRLDLCTVQPR